MTYIGDDVVELLMAVRATHVGTDGEPRHVMCRKCLVLRRRRIDEMIEWVRSRG